MVAFTKGPNNGEASYGGIVVVHMDIKESRVFRRKINWIFASTRKIIVLIKEGKTIKIMESVSHLVLLSKEF